MGQEPKFNDRTLSEWLTMLKEDPTPRKRRAAIVALGEIARSYEPAGKTIFAALGRASRHDASGLVRQQAATTLGLQTSDDATIALDDLIAAIKQEQELAVRVALADTLGRFAAFAKPAVPSLILALDTDSAELSIAAARTLGRVGPEAAPAAARLQDLVKHEQVAVQRAAVYALGRVAPEDKTAAADTILKFLTRQTDPESEREAVLALGLLGDNRAEICFALAERLTQPNLSEEQRFLLLETLAKLPCAEPKIIQILQEQLNLPRDKEVRRQAVRTLGRCLTENEPEQLRLFQKLLTDDPDFEVRIAVIEQLGTFQQQITATLPLLRQAQKDPQIQVREAASTTLKKLTKRVPK